MDHCCGRFHCTPALTINPSLRHTTHDPSQRQEDMRVRCQAACSALLPCPRVHPHAHAQTDPTRRESSHAPCARTHTIAGPAQGGSGAADPVARVRAGPAHARHGRGGRGRCVWLLCERPTGETAALTVLAAVVVTVVIALHPLLPHMARKEGEVLAQSSCHGRRGGSMSGQRTHPLLRAASQRALTATARGLPPASPGGRRSPQRAAAAALSLLRAATTRLPLQRLCSGPQASLCLVMRTLPSRRACSWPQTLFIRAPWRARHSPQPSTLTVSSFPYAGGRADCHGPGQVHPPRGRRGAGAAHRRPGLRHPRQHG